MQAGRRKFQSPSPLLRATATPATRTVAQPRVPSGGSRHSAPPAISRLRTLLVNLPSYRPALPRLPTAVGLSARFLRGPVCCPLPGAGQACVREGSLER